MMILKKFVAWAVPDVPSDLALKKKREEHIAETKLNQHSDKSGGKRGQPKTYI